MTLYALGVDFNFVVDFNSVFNPLIISVFNPFFGGPAGRPVTD